MKFPDKLRFFSHFLKPSYLISFGMFVLIVCAVSFFRGYGNTSFDVWKPGFRELNIAYPDALIKTKCLVKLPRDLIRIPIFKDLLTEDFVFYYEQNEGYLSMSGTLRRIAYEHNLNLGDWVTRMVLDESAEIALWKGPSGRLTHYLIAMSRNNLAKLLEMAVKVAMDDKQLKRFEDDLVVDGKSVPIFALSYSNKNTLFFATQGDRMIILSDIGMLMSNGKISDKNQKVLSGLLSKDKNLQTVYQDQFRLTGDNSEHTVIATARYLSFGYQHFFPSLQAIRFDFSKDSWSTQAMIDMEKLPKEGLNTTSLWNMIPANPSVCFALPVDWNASAVLMRKFGAREEQVNRIVAAVGSPVGASWYAKSHLYTPLFVVPLKTPLGPQEVEFLAETFKEIIGGKEENATAFSNGDKRFPVKAYRQQNGAILWQRDVTSYHGIHKWKEKEDGPGRKNCFFRVTLAQHGKSLIFSPDNMLVDDAIAVADKKYPALGDSLPQENSIIAVITPASLAALVQSEAISSLPAKDETIFRGVANERLLPKLAALKKYPAYGLTIAGNAKPAADQWLPVTWQTLVKH